MYYLTNYFDSKIRRRQWNTKKGTAEYKKILNLLNEAIDSKFMTRKWNIINDQSDPIYCVGNEIISNTEVLKSNLCDYSADYILVRADIAVVAVHVTQVAFTKRAPFTKCIPKLME